MRIRVVSIGKFKNKDLSELVEYYLKLMSGLAKVEHVTLHAPRAKTEDAAQEKLVESWLDKNAGRSYLTVLDERGTEFKSREFARKIEHIQAGGHSDWTVVCAGAHGFSEHILSRFHLRWSLSQLTLPHELALVVATEQIFRGLSILANHPYHND